jgi:hypothetical protein
METSLVIDTLTFLQTGRTTDLNSTREVAIDRGYKWNPDMTTCPRNAKVQLLGAGGVAHYGIYFGDPFWIKWAPLPSN